MLNSLLMFEKGNREKEKWPREMMAKRTAWLWTLLLSSKVKIALKMEKIMKIYYNLENKD